VKKNIIHSIFGRIPQDCRSNCSRVSGYGIHWLFRALNTYTHKQHPFELKRWTRCCVGLVCVLTLWDVLSINAVFLRNSNENTLWHSSRILESFHMHPKIFERNLFYCATNSCMNDCYSV